MNEPTGHSQSGGQQGVKNTGVAGRLCPQIRIHTRLLSNLFSPQPKSRTGGIASSVASSQSGSQVGQVAQSQAQSGVSIQGVIAAPSTQSNDDRITQVRTALVEFFQKDIETLEDATAYTVMTVRIPHLLKSFRAGGRFPIFRPRR